MKAKPLPQGDYEGTFEYVGPSASPGWTLFRVVLKDMPGNYYFLTLPTTTSKDGDEE